MSTDKLSSKEIYSILISNIVKKLTSNIYFEKLFEKTTLDWSKIYLLLRLATIDTTLRPFQYKILKNVLFLGKNYTPFGITNTALCSFCNTFEETPIDIFYDCIHVKSLWEKLQTKFQKDIILLSLTPQAAILGLTNEANITYNLLNHILLVFKYYIYRSREKRILNIDNLKDKLIEIKKKEKRISVVSNNKTETFNKKWCITDKALPVT